MQPLPQRPHLRVGVRVRLPEPAVGREREVVPVVRRVDARPRRGCRRASPRCAPRDRAATRRSRPRGCGRRAGAPRRGRPRGTSGESTGMPCTSRAKTRHCSGRSTWCQGVSVPPQSKTTASTGWLTRGRSRRGSRRRPTPTATSRRSPERRSLTSMRAVGQAATDDDDGRHADELGVLELHAGAGLATVVEQHLDAARLELAGELLGVRGDGLVLAGGDDVHVGRGERPRPDRGRARRGCPRRRTRRPARRRRRTSP